MSGRHTTIMLRRGYCTTIATRIRHHGVYHKLGGLGTTGRRKLVNPFLHVRGLGGRHHHRRLLSNSNKNRTSTSNRNQQPTSAKPMSIYEKIKSRPIEYASIPCVAAFVGIITNWMGVKMIFYPIEYMGIELKERTPNTPYGIFGWQGVVPTKTKIMAKRLVNIVTSRLLSLEEIFGRLDPNKLSELLLPAVTKSVHENCGAAWSTVLAPVLPILLPHILTKLQSEIDVVLDLQDVVLQAFIRDKVVLVDLFQKVGRVELEFLVNSGFGFGFLLGIGQMLTWAYAPMSWTLPAAGALVGYATNWIAIKLLFEPAEPYNVGIGDLDLFVVQGLFESRQIEVSDEFANFMNRRVLNSTSLLTDLANGGNQGDLFHFLRRHLPYPIPEHVLSAAVSAIADVAANPIHYPEVHSYVSHQLDIEKTLARRLKLLSPTEFEDMLHPVFQEDEITLIARVGQTYLLSQKLMK